MIPIIYAFIKDLLLKTAEDDLENKVNEALEPKPIEAKDEQRNS